MGTRRGLLPLCRERVVSTPLSPWALRQRARECHLRKLPCHIILRAQPFVTLLQAGKISGCHDSRPIPRIQHGLRWSAHLRPARGTLLHAQGRSPFLIANTTLLSKTRLGRQSGDRLVNPVEITPSLLPASAPSRSAGTVGRSSSEAAMWTAAFGGRVANVPYCKDRTGSVELKFRRIKEPLHVVGREEVGMSGAGRDAGQAGAVSEVSWASQSTTTRRSVALPGKRRTISSATASIDNLGVVAADPPSAQHHRLRQRPGAAVRTTRRLRHDRSVAKSCSKPAENDLLDDLRFVRRAAAQAEESRVRDEPTRRDPRWSSRSCQGRWPARLCSTTPCSTTTTSAYAASVSTIRDRTQAAVAGLS